MARNYDAAVIGGGHNGLTCASYLAAAGLKVLVLEQYPLVGGMTITEEITLPGFRSDIHAFGYQLANLSPAPRELDLARFGFELLKPDPNFSHVFPDGGIVSMHRDIEETAQSIGRYSKKDAETWRKLFRKYLKIKDQIVAGVNSPPKSLGAELSRLELVPGGLDEYRSGLQSTRSWCDEWFEADETKVFLATFASHPGVAPDDGGGGRLAWLFNTIIQDVGNNVVKGGMHNLSLSLAGYLQSRSGEIRTNARVRKIVVKEGRAVGIQLADGEEIAVSQVVASSVDPYQLIVHFLGEKIVGPEIVAKLQRYEWGDSALVIYVALDGPVNYNAGLVARHSAYVHPTPPTLDYFSQVYTECRGGKLPAAPLVIMCNDSAVDPGRTPPNKYVMKLIVNNVPFRITGDATGKIAARTWDGAKEPYADHIIDMITEAYAPNFKSLILKRVVHSPVDIERAIPSAVRGTVTHGAFVPYQMGPMRPIPELSDYRTPVPNVYLCGSGSHPGAGVSMAPGRNAAQVILADLKVDRKTL
ncbi:MAG TPA: NAD(P)/FAD-dependent oxidoreductase [Desulfomonilaceae bacterium]|nr:NAD(P)/FAD-dependent oxidoreductase [Desulfomonilaceae bacterium]